jgi:poly(3-hydroxybutyrate) depolymerase
MYCYQRDKIRAYWQPAHLVSQQAQDFLLSPAIVPSNPPLRAAGAIYEIIQRWTRPNKRPEFNIRTVKCNDAQYTVVEKSVLEKPFCRLKLFEKVGCDVEQPIVLVVAPLSGHYATLLRDTIQTLLQDHTVYVTDWISSYNVSLSDGSFDLDTYVDYLEDFYAFLGAGIHVLAVCQPCVPVLMAAALMAEKQTSYQPTSMILMGGPVDTRINPTVVNKLIEKLPMNWFEEHTVSEVPSYAPGAGRKVTAGNLILGGFVQMNIKSHLQKHYEHIKNVATNNEKAASAHRKFYDEYLTVMDVPAEYFIQTMDKVFKQHLVAKNEMDYRGLPLDFQSITAPALMTIEGENDDITGVGQTYAAHTVCSNIPEYKRDHFLRLDVGHYGVFSGSRWRNDIYPQIRDFIKKHH